MYSAYACLYRVHKAPKNPTVTLFPNIPAYKVRGWCDVDLSCLLVFTCSHKQSMPCPNNTVFMQTDQITLAYSQDNVIC